MPAFSEVLPIFTIAKQLKTMAKVAEVWKDVVDYEGLYEVSSFGQIRSVDRIVPRKNHKAHIRSTLLKSSENIRGYYSVWLCKDGISRTHMVHRVVTIAFLGKSDLFVNHKDFDKSNNRLDNLEWVTHRENIKHYRRSVIKKDGLPLGVQRSGKRFEALIWAHGKRINLGSFSTPELASQAYNSVDATLK